MLAAPARTAPTQFAEIAAFLNRTDSLPYSAEGVHNFRHNKLAVVDDTVITGSFNFSTNAQRNAENVVIIESTRTAFGKHLTYTAADDTYLLTGPTVELYEPQDKGCKKTRAQSFKFRRAVDNIETFGKPVDTQTGVACPGRRD